MRLLMIPLCVSLCLGALACHAPPPRSTPNGEVPATVEIEGTTLLLNGSVHYIATVFGIDVYVGALYLPKTTHDPAEALACAGPSELDFTWVYEADKGDLSNPWRDAMRKNAGADLPSLSDRIDSLIAVLHGVRKGEIWRFIYTPAAGMVVMMDGKETVRIPGQDFCKLFLAGQVGPNADDSLRKGLLGL
jgi:hypothetical protein